MKMKVAIAFFFFLVAGGVSSKDFTIYKKTDEFKGNTIFFTQPKRPKLEGGSFASMRYVYFSFQSISPIQDLDFPYVIRVHANLQSWLFIEEGESLILKVDGEIFPLKGSGSSGGRNVSSLGVEETSYYPISLDALRKFGQAKEIEFKIYGGKGQIEGEFSPKLMSDLKVFSEKAPDLIRDPKFSASIGSNGQEAEAL